MPPYTQQQLDEGDRGIYAIMRARKVQEVLNVLIPGDPPRNFSEYRAAHEIFAMKVGGGPSLVPPLTLIGHWARVAALEIAMQEHGEAHNHIVALQACGCMYGDDNLMLNAAKFGFGVATLLIPIRNQRAELHLTAFSCWKMLVNKGENWSASHGEQAIRLGANFWTLLQDFSMMVDPKENSMGTTALRIKLTNGASEIDKATKSKFRMKNWVNETIRKLGH